MTALSTAKIVIVLATHNGANVLPAMLEGYAAVEPPERPWAMVIVDNASTDATPAILRDFQERLKLSVLSEPVPSKNRALNRALDRIGQTADLYIFTDDDAIPAPDYLRQWERALADHPETELFGATVVPYFREPPPAWLDRYSSHFAELYAETNRQPGEMPAKDIYGPNMAVRGSVLARGHRFNENIGPNSTQPDYPMGSENEFCIRVAKDMEKSPRFVAGPKVRHIVRPNQTTHEFIGWRAYRHGRGVAMRQIIEGHTLSSLTLKSRLRQSLRWFPAQLSIGTAWWQYNWSEGYQSWVREYRRGAHKL